MKKISSLFLFSILLMSFLLFTGCNNNLNSQIDLNEFKVEKFWQEEHLVLFEFTYTQEMFDYEIKNKSFTSSDLLIRCRINNENELTNCGRINNMYGIRYTYTNNSGVAIAHKPNEKVYFYLEFEPGYYEVTFYLEYTANDPVLLLRECKTSFSVA